MVRERSPLTDIRNYLKSYNTRRYNEPAGTRRLSAAVEVDMPILGLPEGEHVYALFITPGRAIVSANSGIEMAQWLSRQRSDMHVYRWHMEGHNSTHVRRKPKKVLDLLERIQ